MSNIGPTLMKVLWAHIEETKHYFDINPPTLIEAAEDPSLLSNYLAFRKMVLFGRKGDLKTTANLEKERMVVEDEIETLTENLNELIEDISTCRAFLDAQDEK